MQKEGNVSILVSKEIAYPGRLETQQDAVNVVIIKDRTLKEHNVSNHHV